MNESQPGVIQIGEVVTGAFEAIGARAFVLIPAAVLFAFVPALAALLVSEFTLRNPGAANLRLLIPYLQLPFVAVYSAFVTRQVLGEGPGAREGVGKSLVQTVRVFAPLLTLQVLTLVAVGLGIILLIVPGALLALAWSVSTPVRVAEPVSITGALRRSSDLTRNNRFRILGLFLIYFAVALALSFASRELGIGFGTAAGLQTGLASMAPLIVASLISSGQRLIEIAGTATLYLALRKAKEGAVEAEIARVFA